MASPVDGLDALKFLFGLLGGFLGGAGGIFAFFRKDYFAELGKIRARDEQIAAIVDEARKIKQIQDEVALKTAKEFFLQQTKGVQLATTQNFSQLQQQLKDQTTLTEGIKRDVQIGLENVKSDLQWRLQIATARLETYRRLWQETRYLDGLVKSNSWGDISQRLSNFYYDQGNAMLLDTKIVAHFQLLLNKDISVHVKKLALSRLRTIIKTDLGVYSEADADTPISVIVDKLREQYVKEATGVDPTIRATVVKA